MAAGLKPRVAIVGAGWAGLSCAVALAEHAQITIFEAAREPGGRARSLARHDTTLDNGQHILIGAYRDTLAMMARVGVDVGAAFLRTPLTLEMHGAMKFRAANLPAPLHVAVGLLAVRGLSMRDKWAALRMLRALKSPRPGASVAEVAAHAQQPARVMQLLWAPLCVSALNTPPETACAATFARVLRDTLATRDASDMLLPRHDLGALFPQPAVQWLSQRGARIVVGQAVKNLQPVDGGVELDGARFDHAVIATAPHHAAKLLDGVPGAETTCAQLASLQFEPILTCYLQYPPHTRLPAPMLGLPNGPAHWLFDRGQISGQPGLIAAVISAQGEHLDAPREALVETLIETLRELTGHATPLWHQVITEKRATFACTPDAPRVAMETGAPRVWLAGDYLEPHYPATLESAVRSGLRVAGRIGG